MITEKELLTGLLSAAYQMDEAGVASLYNEDGSLKDDSLTTLLGRDADRVKSLKPDTKKIFDDGYKKATGEVLTKTEKEFIEKTGFKSDKKGIELFIEYAAQAQKQSGGELTEDAIKKHPTFISITEKLLNEKEAAVKAKEDEFIQFKTELQKKDVFAKVSERAIVEFQKMKPILSQNPEKAKAQERLFIEKLNSYEYDLQGDVVVVMKDGKVVEDNHGHRVPFENVIKSLASTYYDFHQADPRTSTGHRNDANNGGQQTDIQVPKTQADYNKLIADPSIPIEQRTAIAQAYKAANPQTV